MHVIHVHSTFSTQIVKDIMYICYRYPNFKIFRYKLIICLWDVVISYLNIEWTTDFIIHLLTESCLMSPHNAD